MIRILLVDDSLRFVREVSTFLERSGAGHVEWVSSAEAALERLERGGVDVVLMDIDLPGLDGLEATRQLKRHTPAPRVVIVTLHDEPEYASAARQAGADGFLGKSVLGDALLSLLDEVLAKASP